MKSKTNHYLIAFLFTVTFSFCAKSQIAITNLSELAKIKRGTTYIAMKDPSSEKSKAYIDVFKKYWTISKYEFIKYTDIEKYISPENSFVTIGGYETNVQFTKQYTNGSIRDGINYSHTHLYLELWTCSEKYFKSEKKNKVFGRGSQVQVARIELFTDFRTLSDPDLLFQSDYDGEGHIRNWGPGILKNYLQLLMSYLNKNKDHGLFAGIQNKKELRNLKKETLYVPDYVLTKFNKFTGNESKKHKEEKIFKHYNFKYQIIPTAELNQKILADETPFYYLIYVKSSTDKYVSVINSSTGEMIYTTYQPMSYNIKSKDLKALQKQIK